jgi:chromosomal replication initiation ATPase DnaA
MLDNGVNAMKKMKVKYGNVLDYFINDLDTLPKKYVKECEKFFNDINTLHNNRKNLKKTIDNEVKKC